MQQSEIQHVIVSSEKETTCKFAAIWSVSTFYVCRRLQIDWRLRHRSVLWLCGDPPVSKARV